MKNAERLQTRSHYPLPKVPAARTPQLDSYLKSEISQGTKAGDKDLARIQTFVLDLAPLTAILEGANNSQGDLKRKHTLDSVTSAVALIGNATAKISHLRKEKVTSDLNKALLPIILEDEKFTKAPPALFGTEFAKTAKEHVDQVKALRSTLGAREAPKANRLFGRPPLTVTWGGVQKADLHPQARKGWSLLPRAKRPRELQLLQEVQTRRKEGQQKLTVLSPVLSPVYPIKSLHSTKDQIACMGVVPISANNHQLAGRLAHHILNWGALTRDCWVLNTVQGYQIEFEAEPHQNRQPHPSHYSQEESQLIQEELQALLLKGAVTEVRRFLLKCLPSPQKGWRSEVISRWRVSIP